MKKSVAIRLLGGSVPEAARLVGISPSAIYQWPEDEEGDIPESAENRVLAAQARRHLPPELIGHEAGAGEAVNAG